MADSLCYFAIQQRRSRSSCIVRAPTPPRNPKNIMNFNELGLEPELLSAIAAHGYSDPHADPGCCNSGRCLPAATCWPAPRPAPARPRPSCCRLLQRLKAHRGPRTARARARTDARTRRPDPGKHPASTAAHKKLRSRVIFGGVGERPQIDGLRDRLRHPGRNAWPAARPRESADWPISSEVQHLVLDEADRMLDMGFIHDIQPHHQAAAARSART